MGTTFHRAPCRNHYYVLRFYTQTSELVRYRCEISQEYSHNIPSGGAERLVVDAALGLQNRGHSVDIYTSYHDPNHCFEETRDGKQFRIIKGCVRDNLSQEPSAFIMYSHHSPDHLEGNSICSSLTPDNYISQTTCCLNPSRPMMSTLSINFRRVYHSSGSCQRNGWYFIATSPTNSLRAGNL